MEMGKQGKAASDWFFRIDWLVVLVLCPLALEWASPETRPWAIGALFLFAAPRILRWVLGRDPQTKARGASR